MAEINPVLETKTVGDGSAKKKPEKQIYRVKPKETTESNVENVLSSGESTNQTNFKRPARRPPRSSEYTQSKIHQHKPRKPMKEKKIIVHVPPDPLEALHKSQEQATPSTTSSLSSSSDSASLNPSTAKPKRQRYRRKSAQEKKQAKQKKEDDLVEQLMKLQIEMGQQKDYCKVQVNPHKAQADAAPPSVKVRVNPPAQVEANGTTDIPSAPSDASVKTKPKRERKKKNKNAKEAQKAEQAEPSLVEQPGAAAAAKIKPKRERRKKKNLKENQQIEQVGHSPTEQSDSASTTSPASAQKVNPKKDRNARKQQDRKKGKENRKKFAELLSTEEVQKGLQDGSLVQGCLRINPHNRQLAYATVEGFERDILIDGAKQRNRAFDLDIVAIQLLPEEVEVKPEAEVKPEVKAKVKLLPTHAHDSDSDIISDTEEVEALHDKDAKEEDKDGDSKSKKRRVGVVVGIIESKHATEYVGYLKPTNTRPGETEIIRQNDKFAFFVPLDKKAPRFIVSISNFRAKNLVTHFDEWNNNLFLCKEDFWSSDSEFPRATLLQNVGKSGELSVELLAILKQHVIDPFSEFPKNVMEGLPSDDWQVPVEEIKLRRDLRKERIFTIDPITARDMDDAISCIIDPENPDIAEVGVHIADVTYFVKEGSSLDEFAKIRATTVYLVEFCIPMLPRILCDMLCSLNPHVDRLAISVIWKMNIKTAEIIGQPWIGRTIIRSCCKLDYGTAQMMIEDNFDTKSHQLTVSDNHSVDAIVQDVKNLDNIARILRRNRYNNGALQLETVKLCFRFNEERTTPPIANNALFLRSPDYCYPYESKDSNHLIEEFALLANGAVAHKIFETYPKNSLIRIHEPPRSELMEEYVEFCEKIGVHIDYSSSGALHRSIQAANDPTNPYKIQVIQLLATKAFKQARYLCTGYGLDEDEDPVASKAFVHYALCAPLYTHFTSPIRRYADIAVHRILLSALENNPKPPIEITPLAEIASNCNDKKKRATYVQEDCDYLYLWALLRKHPIKETAVVIGVHSKTFEVLVPRLGEAQLIHLEDLVEVASATLDDTKTVLKLGLADVDEFERKQFEEELKDRLENGQKNKKKDNKKHGKNNGKNKKEEREERDDDHFIRSGRKVDRWLELSIFSEIKVQLRAEKIGKRVAIKMLPFL